MSHKLNNVSQATYLKASESYCLFFLENGKIKVQTRPMKYFEADLANFGWCRIHKSYMVNPAYVRQISEDRESIFLQSGIKLPISRRKKRDVLKWRNF